MERFEEIRKLWGIWDDSFGFSEEEISKCENRLGNRLPEILRQYYLQFGKNEELNQTQDCLQYPSYLQFREDGFVVFYIENQGVWQAGIKFSDFDQKNQKVYFCYDQKNWGFEVVYLRDFLVFQAFLQSLFVLPFNANSNDLNNEKEKFIRENWKKLDVPQILPGTEFFQNSSDEILALMKSENNVSLFIATNQEEKFWEIIEKIDLDWWDYNSIEDE